MIGIERAKKSKDNCSNSCVGIKSSPIHIRQKSKNLAPNACWCYMNGPLFHAYSPFAKYAPQTISDLL